MDDYWSYHHFRKPLYLYIYIISITKGYLRIYI